MANNPRPVAALILVDVQSAFLAGAAAVPNHDQLIDVLGMMLARARDAGGLVIHLQNDGPVGAVDHPANQAGVSSFQSRSPIAS